jgi:LytS/YehU family sensor histidine kinase
LIDKNNAAARDVLHKFSDMLRFQLYELNGEKIAIEKEIGYLKDYVDLQQLRLEHCVVHFNCPPNVACFTIEPLLLIAFVENAFKHISHYSHKNNEVTIGFNLEDNVFKFYISNTSEVNSQPVIGKQGGIGLANVQRRLELLYPANHTLSISETDDSYTVVLTLKIDT